MSDIDLMVDSNLHGLRFVDFLGDLCDALQKEMDLPDLQKQLSDLLSEIKHDKRKG